MLPQAFTTLSTQAQLQLLLRDGWLHSWRWEPSYYVARYELGECLLIDVWYQRPGCLLHHTAVVSLALLGSYSVVSKSD